jgi:formylmethanofuran dehydrogenase subunit E
MNVGHHTFQEFKDIAARFHGYPAPGLLIGGYMVEHARSLMPEGVLFDAVVETAKCLPDAVQILTPLSVGNGWLKILNLGRYALTLYDKHEGPGMRIWIDAEKLEDWPEIKAWFLKLKAKKDQDTDKLFAEIEAAGHTICSTAPVVVDMSRFSHKSMGEVAVCPVCAEPFPRADGALCRGCQGEAPYLPGKTPVLETSSSGPRLKMVPVEEAVGHAALHDMTRISEDEKGPAFTAGQEITPGDVCRLQRMGRNRIYVLAEEEIAPAASDLQWVHENEAALDFAQAMAGPGVVFSDPPKEGKITFSAGRNGLLHYDPERLALFNQVPDVICASRQADLLVEADKPFAATRAVPLYLSRANHRRAMAVLAGEPLFSVLPLTKAKVGILVTGTEVFKGLIQDRFIPIITSKVEDLGCTVVGGLIRPDDADAIASGVRELVEAGAELIVTTAGLSVDPDDVTRLGLVQAGLHDEHYGMPVLPGTMLLVGKLGDPEAGEREVSVVGVPACALYFKTTGFDLVLPRVLAGLEMGPREFARMGEGGFCLGCKACTFPKCPFGK